MRMGKGILLKVLLVSLWVLVDLSYVKNSGGSLYNDNDDTPDLSLAKNIILSEECQKNPELCVSWHAPLNRLNIVLFPVSVTFPETGFEKQWIIPKDPLMHEGFQLTVIHHLCLSHQLMHDNCAEVVRAILALSSNRENHNLEVAACPYFTDVFRARSIAQEFERTIRKNESPDLFYHEVLQLIILEEVEDNSLTFFDVGSNVGNFTMSLLGILCKNKNQHSIHAFEPVPGTLSEMVRRLEHEFPSNSLLNGTRLFLQNTALSNSNGSTKMYVPLEASHKQDAENVASSSQRQRPQKFDAQLASFTPLAGYHHSDLSHSNLILEVETLTLDSYCNENVIPQITLLKIDCEGADPLVLEGAYSMLEQNRIEVLIFEYNSVWTTLVDIGWYNLKNTVSVLDDFGYESFFIGDSQLFPLSGFCWQDFYEVFQWSNILAVRRGNIQLMQRITQLFYSKNK